MSRKLLWTALLAGILIAFQNCSGFSSDKHSLAKTSAQNDPAFTAATQRPPLYVYGFADPSLVASAHIAGVRGHLGTETDTAVQSALEPYSTAIEVLPNVAFPNKTPAENFANMLETAGFVAGGAVKTGEISIDDFVNWFFNQGEDGADRLGQIIDAVKARRLLFGVTIYSAELGVDPRWPYPAASVPEDLREKVDRIHFYPLFRDDFSNYWSDYAKVQAMFPNAKIIMGLYAYDRRAHEAEMGDMRADSSLQHEIESYQMFLDASCRAVLDKGAEAIEVFPGNWGFESAQLSSGLVASPIEVETMIQMRNMAVHTFSTCLR